jgi:hypothetical protein
MGGCGQPRLECGFAVLEFVDLAVKLAAFP